MAGLLRHQHRGGEEHGDAPESAEGAQRKRLAASCAQRDRQHDSEHDVNRERKSGACHGRESTHGARERIVELRVSAAPGPGDSDVSPFSRVAVLGAGRCPHCGQDTAQQGSSAA